MSTPETRTAARLAGLIKAIRKMAVWSVIHTTLLTIVTVLYATDLFQADQTVWGVVISCVGGLFAFQTVTTIVNSAKLSQVEDDLRAGVRQVKL